MEKTIVALKGVNKWYGSNHVVKDLDLEVAEGEFLTLLGPSGCGKTTTLRMIAGFEDATSGRIEIQGEGVDEKEPYQRDVNTVFQSYSLFPHLNVFDNIAYGPRIKKIPKEQIEHDVEEMLRLVQMTGYEKRKPDALSGGQKQRIAIARALINNPRVLLLDEPEIGLDEEAKQTLEEVIKERAERGMTVLITSHDLQSISNLSTRIMILSPNSGKHSGMIFYGTEDVLRHRFLPVNRMTIKYEGSIPMVDDLPLVKYSLTHDEFICEYDERYVSASEILTVIMKHTRVTDIKIKKPDLEQIILRER